MYRNSLSLIASIGLVLIPASIYLGGCSEETPNVQTTQSATNRPLSPEQLQELASLITVKVVSGDNRGSGTLIRKQGEGGNQVYTVLTNDHVLGGETTSSVETPDGQTHQAVVKTDEQFAGKDAVLLTFRSSDNYQVATQTGTSPTVNDRVLAAGFPFDENELRFATGTVELFLNPALKNGYQIGYSSEIQQGMSGGPVLNGQGELVAINGLAPYPVLQQAYVYEDGSLPDDDLRQQMNRVSWGVPVAMLYPMADPMALPRGGDEIASNPAPNQGNEDNSADSTKEQNRPLTGLAAEVDEVAAQITVRIEGEKGNGSGAIVAQNDTIYYVATATHVVKKKAKYQVITPDGQRYPVDYGKVTLFPGVDLAVLQFSSQETYPVATLGKYNLKVDEMRWVFLSGWPKVKPGNPFQREFTGGLAFSEAVGSIVVKDAFSLANGYELVYTNLSKRGMSGGPVLDTQGRVIGINAAVEGDILSQVQLGLSLGVPIRTLVGLASQAGIQPEWLKVETALPPKLTEEQTENQLAASVLTLEKPSSTESHKDWVNYGNQLWRVDRNQEAVEAFDQAIKINPNFYPAWYGRGLALKGEEKYREAIASFEKVTQLKPTRYEAWRERGVALAELKDYAQALASIDEAIKQSKQPDFNLHWMQGNWLGELEGYSEAVDAYSEAIKIKPHLLTYNNRGLAWSRLEQYEKAIADLDQAIKLDPALAQAYNNQIGRASCRERV